MIVDAMELITAESLSQRYAFMVQPASRTPFLTTVVHDDACHLKLFGNQRKRATDIAQRLGDMTFNVYCT